MTDDLKPDLENDIDVEETDEDDNLEVPNDTVPVDEGGDN